MAYEPTIVYDQAGYAAVTPRGQLLGVTVQFVPSTVGDYINNGGTYADDGIDYSWRGCYHEIQGNASFGGIAGHQYPPHVWYDTEKRILFQSIRLSRSAMALYQGSGYKTNKARCLQVELSGYSEYQANEPLQFLQNIAEDVLIPWGQWLAKYHGFNLDIQHLPDPWVISGSASEYAPQRLGEETWRHYNGMLEHANVPQNDHWDCGALDIWRISAHAALLIGGLLVEDGHIEEEDFVQYRCLQAPNDTLYVVTDQGKITLNELMKVHNQKDGNVFLNELYNAGMLKDKFWSKIGWYGLAVIPWRQDAQIRV